MYDFLILGGDARQLYLHHILSRNGYKTMIHYKDCDLPLSLDEMIQNSRNILCPIPFTKDQKHLFSVNALGDLNIQYLLKHLTRNHSIFGGNIPDFVKEHSSQKHISCFDYMEMDPVSIKNTVATAEGAIAEAITLSPLCLHNSNCLITGFGRCGKTLALKLKGLNCHVTVADRDESQLALAASFGMNTKKLTNLSEDMETFHFIFNTIPALVIDANILPLLSLDVSIIDIASAPGGVDLGLCGQMDIKAKLCPGLPGIYAPMASAEILYQAILSCLS